MEKNHHVFQFQLNKGLFLPNTFDNLSMSTLLFKQHSCGTAKFRKDLFNMPLQQLAPGKVQLAYPASKYVLSLYLSSEFPFCPLLSTSFPIFFLTSQLLWSFQPELFSEHLAYWSSNPEVPFCLPSWGHWHNVSVRCICQVTCVSWHHDCRSK